MPLGPRSVGHYRVAASQPDTVSRATAAWALPGDGAEDLCPSR